MKQHQLIQILVIISETTTSFSCNNQPYNTFLAACLVNECTALIKKMPDVSFLCVREMYKIVKEKDNFRSLQGVRNTEIIRKNHLMKLFLGSK